MCGRPPAGPLTGRPLTGAQRDKSLAVVFLLLACISLILERRGRDGGFALSYTPKPLSRHMAGLLWSAVAIVGRPMASALRKELATPRAGKAVSNAEQAYKVGEMSLCGLSTFFVRNNNTFAQSLDSKEGLDGLVGTMVLPLFSGGWPCAPSLRKASAVACIAAGMLALSMTDQARAGQRGLPKGAGFIILNCFLYSATYRLDAAAVGVSSSLCLFAYCRLIMAAMCFSSTRLWKRGREGDSTGLWEPRALLLLIFVCVVDAAYMLSMYQAVSLISPVLVSAVKRGGGIVVSALFGAIFFNEKLEGRKQLLFVVAVGVMILCV
ncbi:unnamed protein product [Durusdinium trenchii]|uniref:EamA domain-containing protein n=1 Tax=Durusdinium trenchii TaxID=1381693 RepID=A0ABP0ID77_9DINO